VTHNERKRQETKAGGSLDLDLRHGAVAMTEAGEMRRGDGGRGASPRPSFHGLI
jgi:hypothetical protein